MAPWLSSRALDLWSLGHGFDSHRGLRCIETWANCSHLCASVTKQYNLVPVKGWWHSLAGKVTAGLAESNGSQLPDDELNSSAGWLPVHWDQLQAQHSITSMGELYLLYEVTMSCKYRWWRIGILYMTLVGNTMLILLKLQILRIWQLIKTIFRNIV